MPTRELQENEIFDEKYRVLARIGRGGMAIVYHVVDVGAVPAEHALKVIRRSAFPTEESLAVAKARFLLEARTTARLRHPHIIDVHRYGEAPDGTPYLLLELLDGQDLATVLRRKKSLPWATALAVIEQTAQALDVVHGAGHVHRDLSPGNLFLCKLGAAPPEEQVFVKLLDLGIATTAGAEPEPAAALTRPDLRIGNPLYMTPESILKKKGVPLDGRADQFSLASILFEMLAGSPAFRPADGEPLEHAFGLILSANPLDRDLPPIFTPALRAVLERAFSKDPTQRHPTMQDFVAALKAADPEAHARVPVAPEPPTLRQVPRPRRRQLAMQWFAFAICALALTGFVWGPNVLHLGRTPPPPPPPVVKPAQPVVVKSPPPPPPPVKPQPAPPTALPAPVVTPLPEKAAPAPPAQPPAPPDKADPKPPPRTSAGAGFHVAFEYIDDAHKGLVKPHLKEYEGLFKKCLQGQSGWKSVEVVFLRNVHVYGLPYRESNQDVAGCLDRTLAPGTPRPTRAVIKRRTP